MENKEPNKDIAKAFSRAAARSEASFSRQYIMRVHDETLRRWNRKEKTMAKDK